MPRKTKTGLSISFLIKIIVATTAYFYIYYRIKSSIIESHNFSFALFSVNKAVLLFFAFVLMLPNWLLESVKWKKLVSVFHKMSFQLATKSVLLGITCSIFTPYRIGEYFGRPVILPKEKKALGVLANIVGSISQNIVTYSLGIIGAIFLLISEKKTISFDNQPIIIILLILILLLFLLFYFNFSIPFNLLKKVNITNKNLKKITFIAHYSKKELLIILLISFIRYFTFFLQYFLLLRAFDIHTTIIEAFTAISLGYVFLFSIPGIPIADIGIRGSLALFFLGMYSSNEVGILAASSLLWIINLAMPAFIGSIFLIRHKKTVN